jgi:hypothetical protein
MAQASDRGAGYNPGIYATSDFKQRGKIAAAIVPLGWLRSRRLLEKIPVQRPVLDGLEHVVRPDFRRTGEIGQGSRDLEDAVVRPGGEIELLHRMLQVTRGLGIVTAMFFHLAGAHGRVGRLRVGLEPPALDFPCGFHPLADPAGILAAAGGGEFAVVHQRHLDVQVDAVEQRPGDPLAVAFDLPRRAAALPLAIPVVAAGMRFLLGEILSMKG